MYDYMRINHKALILNFHHKIHLFHHFTKSKL